MMMQRALFPLPIFLLPGGITRLSIFEPRYIRMVKESAGDTGFALSLYQQDSHLNLRPWATLVKIIDFQSQANGLLAIDVKAESLVSITEPYTEKDSLNKATLSYQAHWPTQQHNAISLDLSQALKTVFKENTQYSSLYLKPNFTCASWVCQRWLELVPICSNEKEKFIDEQSFELACEFLSTLILGKKAKIKS